MNQITDNGQVRVSVWRHNCFSNERIEGTSSVPSQRECTSRLHNVLSEGYYCFYEDGDEETNETLKRLKQVLQETGPNDEGQCGKSPLELAIDYMVPPKLVETLIDEGATFAERDGSGIQDKDKVMAKRMAKQMPESFRYMLDKFVEFDPDEPPNDKRKIRLDWRPLVYDTETEGSQRQRGSWKETEFLRDVALMKGSRNITLTHPLIQAFVRLKNEIFWPRFAFGYSILSLLAFVLYMTVVYKVYYFDCRYGKTEGPDFEGSSSSSTSAPADSAGRWCEFQKGNRIIAIVALICFLCGPLLLEGREITAQGRFYFYQWQNYVHVLSSVFLVLVLWPLFRWDVDGYDLTWEYSCAAIGMFLASISLMIQLTPLSFITTYAEMLYKVSLQIVLVSVCVSPVFLGFFFGFRILLDFEAVSTWKLVTMVVTGIEYDDDLLYGGGSNFYVTITYIFFLGSIVLIGMVLLNFLIGIAVSDVQELKLTAQATKAYKTICNFYTMDSIYGGFYRSQKYLIKSDAHFYFRFDPLTDKRFPKELRAELLRLARKNWASSKQRQRSGIMATNYNNKEEV